MSSSTSATGSCGWSRADDEERTPMPPDGGRGTASGRAPAAAVEVLVEGDRSGQAGSVWSLS